jgi:hypothetical protein
MDREIRCNIISKDTGKQCDWITTDSKRQTSTTNMRLHLKQKHRILPPGISQPVIVTPKSTILGLWGNRGTLAVQELLERNLRHWVVSS